MKNNYTYNKKPKIEKLCQAIRKMITLNRKGLGLSFKDVAHELGMSEGTLINKIKPSMHTNDLTLSEFIHLLELTGCYEPLEFIASEFDLILIPRVDGKVSIDDIEALTDSISMETSDVFRTIKQALSDDNLEDHEIDASLKELDEADAESAKLRQSLIAMKNREE